MKTLSENLIWSKHILYWIHTIILINPAICAAQNLLQGPQKIVIDTERNRYIVSNWYGGGDLVSIDSLGNQSYFVENAEMTDGMQIVGDTVYGTGPGYSGTVRGYDLETGIQVMNLDLSGIGVEHLSSFVADSTGILIASERFGTRIVKIDPKTHNYWVFADSSIIDEPNGLLYEPEYNRLLVCLDQPYPPILAINLSDSTVSTLVSTNLGGSDGIEKDSSGDYYITGYDLPGIYKFDSAFSQPPELIFQGNYIVYPTYNQKNNSLLITYFQANTWGEVFLNPTNITDQENNPKEFILFQNSPNPFSPSTRIDFEIVKPGFVSLKIFNLYGQEVDELINNHMPSGLHSVIWNSKDLPCGIYYYRLTNNFGSVAKKMVIAD
jgi:hypothetical protein